MADIGEFAAEAAVQFLAHQAVTVEPWNLGLRREAVEEVVKAAFSGSLIPNEHPSPCVCPNTYPDEIALDLHFAFDQPKEPSAVQIARLAHGVGPGTHLCLVSKQGQLAIAGIRVNVLNDRRDLGYNSYQLGNPLKIVVR